MQTIQNSYRGLSLLFEINGDRLLYVGTIALSLATAAYVVSFL